MRVSEELAGLPGVERAAAVMATPLNLELLSDDGLLPAGLQAAPEDLVVAVRGPEDAVRAALGEIDRLLAPRQIRSEVAPIPARTIEEAARRMDGNLAVIAVPGQFAAAEAYAALRGGLHVFLFSDNVSLEDEVELKALAIAGDKLMMGPDCGTAMINGVGLGFANRVRRGPVGIVGASGTGIQQVTCLLDAAGIGTAQAIGTGGRDLSAAVGGSMTSQGLQILADDPTVEIIAVISKPADAESSADLRRQMEALNRPIVACLLGEVYPDSGKVRYATTLTGLVEIVAEGLGLSDFPWRTEAIAPDRNRDGSKKVVGLYAGGTLCSEARQILEELQVPHELVDLGADEYTRGRAHPIIDPRLRAGMLEGLRGREDVGAVLLDVILGDLAHPDPAGALLPALDGLRIPAVAVLVGAAGDPQGLERQRDMFRNAGVSVFMSNVHAARAAGALA
jgi:FdrA protein